MTRARNHTLGCRGGDTRLAWRLAVTDFKGLESDHRKSLGLQIAQGRYCLQTLDPKVGTICILGALGNLLPHVGVITGLIVPVRMSMA